jgi:hypothetical protein
MSLLRSFLLLGLVSLQIWNAASSETVRLQSPSNYSSEVGTRSDDRYQRKVMLRQIRSPRFVENENPVEGSVDRTSAHLTSKTDRAEEYVQEPHATEQSGISVGGWVGIGFGIFLVLLIVIYFLIGQRRVTEYFVRIIRDRIQRRDRKISSRQPDTETLDSLEVRCSSKSENRNGSKLGSSIGHYETNAGTPMTVYDIPVAPIEIEADGRMSPKLPIASRQVCGSSIVVTP